MLSNKGLFNRKRDDSARCTSVIPQNFQTYKCKYNSAEKTCTPTKKVCGDYNKIGSDSGYIGYSGDVCTNLVPETDTGDRCILIGGYCLPYFNQCSGIVQSKCNSNILPGKTIKKCNWEIPEGGTVEECVEVNRYCEDAYFDPLFQDKTTCNQLKLEEDDDNSDANTNYQKKKCIYDISNNRCIKTYKSCNSYTGTTEEACNNYTPLNSDRDDYDYSLICFLDEESSDNKCKQRERKCSEYNVIPLSLRNEEMCNKLIPSEGYDRCAYDENSKICYDEYDTCEKYITNNIYTDRSGCEKIRLRDKTKECVYDHEEDKCLTRNIYSTCGDYTGNDKKICESILLSSSEAHPLCILDKDENCIERPLLCSEANSKDVCLKVAKAQDDNKRCAYASNGACYEEYMRCEDYEAKFESRCASSSSSSDGIILYNGKTCEVEPILNLNSRAFKCKSIDKTCSQATTEEECKLITKTGVSDPERKMCSWEGTNCVEKYKYCSDYRTLCGSGAVCRTICENIKPHDTSGENVIFGSKCKYDDYVGCQREPVECRDADNAILCNAYSEFIKDKDKKHCVFSGGNCREQYKKCQDVELNGNPSRCSNNIISGYVKGLCTVEDGKCIEKKECSKFNSLDYGELCQAINHNCKYDSDNNRCYSEEITECENIEFHKTSDSDEQREEICKSMTTNSVYTICTLSEDKSGCKEVYKNYTHSTTYKAYTYKEDDTTESSSFIQKARLVILLLCLLI